MDKAKLILNNEAAILKYVDAPTESSYKYIGSVYPDYSGAEFVVYDGNNNQISSHWISDKGILEAIK